MKWIYLFAAATLFSAGMFIGWLGGPRVIENPNLFPTRIYLIVDDQVETYLVSRAGLTDDVRFEWEGDRSWHTLTDQERKEAPYWIQADPAELFTTKAAADSALCDLLNKRLEGISKRLEDCTK